MNGEQTPTDVRTTDQVIHKADCNYHTEVVKSTYVCTCGAEKPHRTDTERLEWLMVGTGRKKSAHVNGSEERGYVVFDCSNGLAFMSPQHEKLTFRQAIDAAMEKCP